jgi:hypothetical protein
MFESAGVGDADTQSTDGYQALARLSLARLSLTRAGQPAAPAARFR